MLKYSFRYVLEGTLLCVDPLLDELPVPWLSLLMPFDCIAAIIMACFGVSDSFWLETPALAACTLSFSTRYFLPVSEACWWLEPL